jgi:hypothetical protein
VITVTYTPTFDLLRELLAEDERRAAAKTLNALCQWLAWQLPIGTVKQISIYADDKLVELGGAAPFDDYTALEDAVWRLALACQDRIRSNRESNRDRATRIVNAILDVVARGSELPTDLFRQEAIARAARIIGGDA